MKRARQIRTALPAAVLASVLSAFAQPQPGDVFREHMYVPPYAEYGDKWLRVGGQYDYGGGNLDFPGDVGLENAVKAEVYIEKVLCHDQTRGLSISVNDNAWILVPEAEKIPSPQYNYQHFFFPTVNLPLAQLREGGNVFKMKVDNAGWWPQNLIYGVHLRVYYDADKVDRPGGKITAPADGETIGMEFECTAEVTGDIKQVDFIAYSDDVNWEGDGEYRQWHYHFHRGTIQHNIGSATEEPWSVTWNTEWVPNQEEPMKMMARIVDNRGMVFMTPAVEELDLARNEHGVELCKPYNVPAGWVTRLGAKSEKFDVEYDMSEVKAVKLAWSGWASGGTVNGITINGQKVLDGGEYWNYIKPEEEIDNYSMIKQGTNTLGVGGSPSGHHGMEINWPGIQVLIQYVGEAVVETGKGRGNDPVATGFDVRRLGGAKSFVVNVPDQGRQVLWIVTPEGRLVTRRVSDGPASYEFGPDDLAPGLYVVGVRTDNETCSRKIAIAR